MIVTTAYSHLTNESIRIFIALYTAFLLYLDDIFQNNIQPLREFNERFVLKQSQENEVLNSFADLLLEMPELFTGVVFNIMINSTLNFVTGLLLEYETRGMAVKITLLLCEADSYIALIQLRQDAKRFPTFSRFLSGAAESYAIFIFPTEIGLPTFIQALPEAMTYINTAK